jgi:hypothetical protein
MLCIKKVTERQIHRIEKQQQGERLQSRYVRATEGNAKFN